MRRQLTFVLLMLLTTVFLVSIRDNASTPDTAAAMPAAPIAMMRTSDGRIEQLALEPIEVPAGPLSATAGPATNSCSLAPSLGVPEGGSTNVRNFNAVADGSDPVLSCMWGNPADGRGFRTAWYKLQPSAYGLVSISTWSSNYDTVLAVYTGACEALVELACNDDSNYFSSRVELQVQAGETYYVEVADWHSAASGDLILNLQSENQPIDSQWQLASAGSAADSFRSRHVVLADGTKLYVISGQTSVGSNSVRTPTMYVYDTATNTTQYLSNMPGGSDGLGYSNTTAVLIGNRIYMPAGYTGINDGTHWVYNITNDLWSDDVAAENTLPSYQPAIFSQADAYDFGGPPGNGYFLSGGMTGVFPVSDNSANWSPRSALYFYSVDSNSWFELTSMPTGRFGHVAAVQYFSDQDHLCVAGGMAGNPGTDRVALDSTSCYDTSQGTWSEFAPLNYARYFASSAVDSQGNWYVFGGYDNADNLIGITERYDATNDEWVVLGPGYSVVPPRAWSRGAYVGNTLWIVGGEITNENVVNIVQKTILFRGPIPYYLPVVFDTQENAQRNDTFATARAQPYPSSVFDRFYGTNDIVNVYSFDVPSPRRAVRIRLDHQGSGNHLDMVLYNANKGFVTASRQPGTITEDVTINLDPGRYFIAVERIFPPVGFEPSQKNYLLQVIPG